MTNQKNNQEQIKKSISLIVKRYRGDKSLREFAADLSSKLPVAISHQTIKNWEDEIFVPEYYPMVEIALKYDDWRRRFALDILKEIKPEYFEPDQIVIQKGNDDE